MIASGEIPDPSKASPKFTWRWDGATVGGTVEANTKGEAVSQIKKLMGLKRKAKLPSHVTIEKLHANTAECTEPCEVSAAAG